MVLAHYHGLCSFVLGQGLTEDSQRVLEQIQLMKANSSQSTAKSPSAVEKGEVSDADTYTIRALKQTYGCEDDDDVSSSSF